jgi:hypothetical protein
LIQHAFAYGQASDDIAPFELEIVYHRCVWLLVICAVFVLVYFKKLPTVAAGLVTILIIESISLTMYPKIMGHYFRPVPPISKDRFAPHPLLQMVLNPGTRTRRTAVASGNHVHLGRMPTTGLLPYSN